MTPIVRLLLLLLIITGTFSCKKVVEEKRKNAFLSAMTNGEWLVESYMDGTTPMTEQFIGYKFQFRENGVVTGMNSNASITGTWKGDIANYSINSVFPESETPLNKLNGTWKITDTKKDFVNAELMASPTKKILQLRKTY